jgi:hypothetical protein
MANKEGHSPASCDMPARLKVPSPLLALLLAGGALMAAAPPGRAETLYKLETRCSLAGAPAQPCSVEAVDEGGATLYRHTIGTTTKTIRITDQPTRIEMLQAGGKQWTSVASAWARFSTNTVCFNGKDLCVVNNNYLNSVRENRAEQMAGRDLVMVHFAPDGRVDATCYDNGCAMVKK